MRSSPVAILYEYYIINLKDRNIPPKKHYGLFVKCGGYSYKEFLARGMKIARAIIFAQ